MSEKLIKIGIYLTIFLPVLGELVRLPFGPENGILASDAIIPIVVALWLYKHLSEALVKPAQARTTPAQLVSASEARSSSEVCNSLCPQHRSIKLCVLLFAVAATLSLLQSLLFLSPGEVITGSMYLIRWIFYALLYFVTYHSIKTEKEFKNVITALTASAVLLAIIGFIQLAVYPNLAELEEYGWDPHINRLVSTWLDPNFLGGLFAFIISILTGLALHTKKTTHKLYLTAPILILLVALFLTYSRSAYLSLAAGIFVISLIKSRKLLIIGLILVTIGLAVSDRARERTAELAQSVTAIFTQTAQNPDPTARLRIKSYNQTLQLIEKRPLLGVGYNNLRAVNHQEGFVTSTDIHNAGGSDSSLLTILATTGIIGFIPFILIYIFALRGAWQNARRTGIALGLFGGIIALLVHSLFVNSLLYSPILIYFWIALGLNRTTKS